MNKKKLLERRSLLTLHSRGQSIDSSSKSLHQEPVIK